MTKAVVWPGVFVIAAIAITAFLVVHRPSSAVPDDAKAAGKTVADFPETASTAFDAMDGGLPLTDEERKGRNTWILWTAGDQVFWEDRKSVV